jgi:hypothetical protein
VGEGLWSATQPLRFLGLELGARMNVVRLPDGGLWLHSPIDPTPTLRQEVARLGPVRHVVAPSRFHHLFAGRWSDAGDGAAPVELHIAPLLLRERPDLIESKDLTDTPDPAWAAVLDQVLVRGMPLVNEVVFLHRPSRTLLCCDLAFHVGPELPAWTRFWFRALGAYGHLETTFLERLLTRDRAAARESLERILAWDFDRVIVAHGRIQETGGREALRAAWRWLLGEPSRQEADPRGSASAQRGEAERSPSG